MAGLDPRNDPARDEDWLLRAMPDEDRRDAALMRLLALVNGDRAYKNRRRGSDHRHQRQPIPFAGRDPAELLRKRQKEVLVCASYGLRYAETAEVLGIGTQTVQSHLKRARHLLRAKTTEQAVAEAIRRGIIP